MVHKVYNISAKNGLKNECASLRWKKDGMEAGLAPEWLDGVNKVFNARPLKLRDAKGFRERHK